MGTFAVPELDISIDQGLCRQWHVIFVNDDYHSMQFVVSVIMKIFKQTLEEATQRMIEVHETGASIITTCPKERAELYLEQVATIKEGEKGAVDCKIEPAE